MRRINQEDTYKSFMENFLIDLGLIPEPGALTADMLASMSAAATANFGASDTMLVSPATYDALKKFRK